MQTSPKMKPVDASKTTRSVSEKDVDAASMASTSTLSSTVSLLKSKFQHKEHSDRKSSKHYGTTQQ
ncbi:hypothetical protein DH86_00000778 [Scytalidium sp. 3C]|nr:hypothetical protein DH86_00000778 [Scytalidium sp. 3C]